MKSFFVLLLLTNAVPSLFVGKAIAAGCDALHRAGWWQEASRMICFDAEITRANLKTTQDGTWRFFAADAQGWAARAPVHVPPCMHDLVFAAENHDDPYSTITFECRVGVGGAVNVDQQPALGGTWTLTVESAIEAAREAQAQGMEGWLQQLPVRVPKCRHSLTLTSTTLDGSAFHKMVLECKPGG